MLGRLGIRGKIIAVVAVPILVLVVAAGVFTATANRNYSSAKEIDALLAIVQAANELSVALQDERYQGANYDDAFSDGDFRRTNAEAAVDADYLSIVDAADTPGDEGYAIRATLAQVDTLLGKPEVITSVEGVDQISSRATGIYALRGVSVGNLPLDVEPELEVEGSFDFETDYIGPPIWPDPLEVANLDTAYKALSGSIEAIAATAPDAGGVRAALIRMVDDIEFEAEQAANALTIPVVILPDLEGTFDSTDEAIAALRALTEGLGYQDKEDAEAHTDARAIVASEMFSALERLADLEGSRNRIIALNQYSAYRISSLYAEAITPLAEIPDTVAQGISDREIARALNAYTDISQFVEAMRFEEIRSMHVIRVGAFFGGKVETDGLIGFQLITDQSLTTAQQSFGALLSIEEPPVFGVSYDAATLTGFDPTRDRLARGDRVPVRTEELGQWPLWVQEELDQYLPIQSDVWDLVKAESDTAMRNALLSTILTAVGAVAILAASIFIALLIARRIIGPLRRLTTTATAVRQELPRLVERVALPGQTVDISEVQIPVESSDEVGRLAEAFNAVNAATLTIAGEQAALRGSISEMFVNVARRDQVLLNRQLASIDEMERSQDDPDTLTRLFALDHLATRMRRNSESLLVLAGIDTGRRMRRPMPLSDVIRTASSEIELYERIQLELDADPAMVGHSALVAGHLFAELLENATVFSDPESPVVVKTASKGDNVIVEITDLGIGMTVEELHEANARIRSTAASEILGAQRLGLFVVGRIARRLGARVEIASEEGEGTTAIVTMPLSLFDLAAEPETDHEPEELLSEKLHVPAALIGHHDTDEVMDVYSDDVMSPAIAGTSYHKTKKIEDEEIKSLIREDAELAPVTDEVDLDELVEGKTRKGLPARRRRSGGKKEASRDTASVLGLPERPTTGQLAQLTGDESQGFSPGEESAASTAEQRSALFRGFRSRHIGDESAVEPNAESLGHVVRRDAVASDAADPIVVPSLEKIEPQPESEAKATPEPTPEPVPEAESVLTEPEPEASIEQADEPEPEAEFEPEAQYLAEAQPEPEVQPEEAVQSQPSLDVTIGSIEVPGVEPTDAYESGEAWDDVPVMEQAESEQVTPVADATPPVAADAVDADIEIASSDDLFPAPSPTKDKKEKKEKRGFLGRRKKQEPKPSPEVAYEPPSQVAEQVPTPSGFETPLVTDLGTEGTIPELEAEPTGIGVDGSATDEIAYAQVSDAKYDEWGLPVERSWPPEESVEEASNPTPEYDEWGLPIVEHSVGANDLDLPPEGIPTPVDPDLDPLTVATPDLDASLYGATQDSGLPVFDGTPDLDVPPLTTGEWAIPTDEASTLEAGPEAITWGVETPEIPPELVEISDLSAPSMTDEGQYLQDPNESGVDSFVQGPPVMEEIPDVSVEPIQRDVPTTEMEPEVPPETVPSFDALIEPPGVAEPVVEVPVATVEIPDLNIQPVTGEFFAPLVTEEKAEDMSVPGLEPDLTPTPAVDQTAIPDMPPPVYDVPDLPPPAVPAYGAESQGVEQYGAAQYAGDNYGTAVQGYSADQFAHPYGWERAGASALEAASGETIQGSYSPEAYMPTAPILPDGSEAEMTSAVFSEFSSLVTERPKIQRTKVGLQVRTKSEEEQAASIPIEEIEVKSIPRDPEAIRLSFSSFHSATNRARVTGGLEPEVRGTEHDEVTP